MKWQIISIWRASNWVPPILSPSVFADRRVRLWFGVFVAGTVLAGCIFAVCELVANRCGETPTIECISQLKAVCVAAHETAATHGSVKDDHRRTDSEVKPFRLSDLKIHDAFCPIILHLTNGKVRSPLLLTYAIKKRQTGIWERLEWKPPNIQLGIPIVFTGESLRSDDRRYGRAWICYADGSVRMGFLPTLSWPIIYRQDNTIEIHFSAADSRFPWATEIEAIRVQPLVTSGMYRRGS